jgi:DEAD/DEAH box helicase domain-containing protein
LGSPVAITFDLETRKLAQDVGGWPALKSGEGGISCVSCWNSSSGRPHFFDENTLQECAALLESADVVCSFNGIDFDVPVIEGILGRKLKLGHHIDLLQLVWEALYPVKRRGNSLDAIAKRTLGRGKTGDGAHAPALYDQGRFAELFDYCLDDVILTMDVLRFAQEHGGVIGLDGELLQLDIPEYFSKVSL